MSGAKISSGRYAFFAVAAVSLMMSSIDHTIVAVAIPGLTASLNADLNWVGWTITSYSLVQISVLPLAGRLSDEWGRKRVFLFCVGTFTVGSLLCGLAPDIGFLIVFRAIQAIGAGGLLPSAVGIVSDQFKERRGQAIGMFASIFPLGAILGPNVGAWILDHWSWRELFFVNVPIGIVIIIAAWRLLSSEQQQRVKQRIDYLGLGLFVAAMVTLMYAMTAAGNDPAFWKHPLLWLMLVAACTLGVLFIKHEARTANPIVEVPMLAKRPFLAANAYNVFFGFGTFGFASFVPYFAVVQYQMSTVETGQVLTPRGLAMVVTSTITSFVLLRLGYRLPMILGGAFSAIGLVLLGLGLRQVSIGSLLIGDFWWMAFAVGLTGVGMGLAAPASNNAVLDMVPERAAAITGLRSMFRNIGGIFGVSLTTLVLSYYDDKAAGMRLIMLGVALILLTTIPLTLMIPDSARQRRLKRKEAEALREG